MQADPLTARVLFDRERLTLARELRGMLKVDLASAVGATAAVIGQYESGVTRPSVAMVGKLAMALRVPHDFFVGDRASFRVTEDQAHFRSLRSVSKRRRQQELARLSLLAELVGHLEGKVRLPAVRLPEVRPVAVAEDIERAAEDARNAWALGLGPIADAVRLLEAIGTVVVRLSPETSGVDAYSCWVSGRPYVVLSPDKADAYRSRFDAAHELGHLLMHREQEPGAKRVETQAHRFASAFLMPRATILRELPKRLDWGAWFETKRRWNVSVAALLRRAHDLGSLTDEAYRRGMIQLSRHGWRTAEPSTGLHPERPQVLARALALLVGESPDALATLADAMRLGIADLETISTVSLGDRRPLVDASTGGVARPAAVAQ